MFFLPTGGPWVYTVIVLINFLISVFALVISVTAFVHCIRQRADAFTAVGTLAKGPWSALLGGATLVTLVVALTGGKRDGTEVIGIFSLLSILAAAVYLLDVRPALRDAAGGHW